jgi:prepilin-type N-terminal cleavage/methylation domain-containing protein
MKTQQQGFSVVELLITLTVAAIAVELLFTMYSTASRLTQRSNNLLIANEIAFNKLQEWEFKEFDDIIAGSYSVSLQNEYNFTSTLPASLPAPKSGELYVSDQTGSLKYIFVRVQYGSGPEQRRVEYGTLVQSGGIGR